MISLKAEKRTETAKKTRKEGKIPGILYGPDIKENIKVKVDKKEFEKILNLISPPEKIELILNGQKFLVLIKEIQRNPITDEIIHLDFFQPSLQETQPSKENEKN
jgi:large subunit ribosomal protein L25